MEKTKTISKVTLEQKFKKMYSSEIVPILKQNKVYDAKKNELYAKINELHAKKNELHAKKNELYAKINELHAKKNELYAKILWKFVKFEKENDCKIEWGTYDFKLEDITIKSNAEIEAEKNKPKVPETIEKDGHTYKLIN